MTHPLKGRKQKPETIAKRKATYAARRAAKLAEQSTHRVAEARAHKALRAGNGGDTRDALIYLHHALSKWPPVKKKKQGNIAELYVRLAIATLEGKA